MPSAAEDSFSNPPKRINKKLKTGESERGKKPLDNIPALEY